MRLGRVEGYDEKRYFMTMSRCRPHGNGCSIQLNGRRFGVSEFGDPQGNPLLYFHGCPGSRLEGGLTHPKATVLGLRVICIDRPGYGLSPMDTGRTLAGWPKDVLALTRAMGVESFGVLGVSGGGPYAAACAAALPEHVLAAGLVCSMAPVDCCPVVKRMWPLIRLLFSMARNFPEATRLLLRVAGRIILINPNGAISLLSALAPAPDNGVLADREIRRVLSCSLREALRQTADGAVFDLMLYQRPWNVSLESIRVPVLLWHGEKDVTVPVEMGRYLSRTIPGCAAVFHPGEGHISLAVQRMGEILEGMGRMLQP
jgi:pimeloyl-ACP methyl ester carboxylesterase